MVPDGNPKKLEPMHIIIVEFAMMLRRAASGWVGVTLGPECPIPSSQN